LTSSDSRALFTQTFRDITIHPSISCRTLCAGTDSVGLQLVQSSTLNDSSLHQRL